MTNLNILHLSDLHIGNFRYADPRTLAVKIANTLDDFSRKVEVIVVSGDVFDGRRKEKDFEEDSVNAINFFNTLIDQLKAQELVSNAFSNEDILFVPGNHDLYREKGREYERYDKFINEYYPLGRKKNIVKYSDKYSFYYAFPSKKIIILGLNSCKIEIEKITNEDLKWIDTLDLSVFSESDEIRKKIKEEKIKEKKWDDFGNIDTIEMANLFTKIKKGVPNLSEYTIVATFHHHFYPFPEIINKQGDPSWIRNYQEVVDNFQRHKVVLVLHGHKHLPIQRAITDNKYFNNPDSVIYVLAAGSAGCKDVFQPSFQWLRIYDKQSAKIADIQRYEFKDEELGNVSSFSLPPQKHEDISVASRLFDTLQTEDSALYEKYKNITDDFEQIYEDNNINKIIDVVGNLLTIFKDINKELQSDPKMVYILLLAINYRVIYLNKSRKPSMSLKLDIPLSRIGKALNDIKLDTNYTHNLLEFLSSNSNKELDDKNYEKIMKKVKTTEKKISSYVSIAVFFTDLFLSISQYGEYYFEKEGIKHKINISLGKDLFYDNIPNQTISIEGNIDRRAIIMNFKCKDPTVHKIAVLIVKDFEMRLNKFEESLKEINLKLYYLLPKVTPDKYDLDNFHFDAYIPTLLPLLTGDNLYKQKEVFIRELVQNCIDAVLLREKLEPEKDFSKTIKIELGVEKRGLNNVKYFKIIDEGIGMTKFTIERYFTSIGRSFYVSEEFEDLQKDNKITYKPISNFGIGFLSSFMVCKEIVVRTRSTLDNTKGLEIQIPNYEGCFFIRNFEKDLIGTEITLYEDSRDLFDFDKFTEYIKYVFINIPLKLEIIDKISVKKSFEIESFAFQKDLIGKNLRINRELILFIPFTDTGIGSLSWRDLIFEDIAKIPKFGLFIEFANFNSGQISLNQGLRIAQGSTPLTQFDDYPAQFVNYPSSFIQLDVAREKIINIKYGINLSDDAIFDCIKSQIDGYLNFPKFLNETTPFEVNSQLLFLKYGLRQKSLDFIESGYIMQIEREDELSFKINILPKSKIVLKKIENKNVAYFDNSNEVTFLDLIIKINKWGKDIQHKKENSLIEDKIPSTYFNFDGGGLMGLVLDILERIDGRKLLLENKEIGKNELIDIMKMIEMRQSRRMDYLTSLLKKQPESDGEEMDTLNHLFNNIIYMRIFNSRKDIFEIKPIDLFSGFYLVFLLLSSSVKVKNIYKYSKKVQFMI